MIKTCGIIRIGQFLFLILIWDTYRFFNWFQIQLFALFIINLVNNVTICDWS